MKQPREVSETELLQALQSFGVIGTIESAVRGYRKIKYFIRTAKGTRVSVLQGLNENLQMELRMEGVTAAVSKGKFVVTLPSPPKPSPSLLMLLQDPSFRSNRTPLRIALGVKDDQTPLVIDLAEQVHLLIAGSTGGGKSVVLHNIICSLVANTDVRECQLVLIDPKGSEFHSYRGIPHLTNRTKAPLVALGDAVLALEKLVDVMRHRNQQFEEGGVRDIAGWNRRYPDNLMAYIVVVIDELADLLSVGRKYVEPSLTSLSQVARSAGIHLVVATQRPSADVITGVIKNNFPSRIALRVQSAVNSRIVLDEKGAETLLGKGDMIFKDAQGGEAIRAQAAYISPDEIDNLRATVTVPDTMLLADENDHLVEVPRNDVLLDTAKKSLSKNATPEETAEWYRTHSDEERRIMNQRDIHERAQQILKENANEQKP